MSIRLQIEEMPVVAHIDFLVARCRLVNGKARNILIGFGFEPLMCFVKRQRLEARTLARKRQCRPIRRISYLPVTFCRASLISTGSVNKGEKTMSTKPTQTETLLTGIGGNICTIIQLLGDLQQSVSSLNEHFKKFIEDQEAQTKPVQEMTQASHTRRDISESPDAG